MNNVKLLHIKCCFFQFFNSPVALKKNLPPQEKVEMTPLNHGGGELALEARFLFKLRADDDDDGLQDVKTNGGQD